jgi:lysophospholipase L1-like esterase
MSIHAMFLALAERKVFTADDLVPDKGSGLWFGWLHHGSFSGTDRTGVLKSMNDVASEGARDLEKADYVVITFGTAWIYRLASTGRVVANCHKQPSAMFTRHRLTVSEIVAAFSELLDGVLKDKKVIFTLSPVRHLKDGFAENSLSKSILRMAIEELTERYANADYFPAYEIVCDDLRDYRFYGPDMVHPSPVAIDYVWDKFTEYAMPPATRALLPRIEKLVRATEHRVMNPESEANRTFRTRMLAYAQELQTDIPDADLHSEVDFFR